ncbi:MAG TPA: hypothetical protein VFV93_01370 [Thermomicrobiales bacterium]|nr:hypothetical protein [Thermomicrobiales bacterium]
MSTQQSGYLPLSAEARRLYQVLLRTVADDGPELSSGAFPDISDTRGGGNLSDFGALVDAGLIAHDVETGLVTAVLPLVAREPATVVYLDDDDQLPRLTVGVVDGFALAVLLDRRVRIIDRCPTCGELVSIMAGPDGIRGRDPRSAVAVRIPADGPRLSSADTIRLTCSPEHGQAALEQSGNPDAVLQSIEGLAIEARERYAVVLP